MVFSLRIAHLVLSQTRGNDCQEILIIELNRLTGRPKNLKGERTRRIPSAIFTGLVNSLNRNVTQSMHIIRRAKMLPVIKPCSVIFSGPRLKITLTLLPKLNRMGKENEINMNDQSFRNLLRVN